MSRARDAERLLEELRAIDPSLAADEARTRETLEALLASRPDPSLDAETERRVRSRVFAAFDARFSPNGRGKATDARGGPMPAPRGKALAGRIARFAVPLASVAAVAVLVVVWGIGEGASRAEIAEASADRALSEPRRTMGDETPAVGEAVATDATLMATRDALPESAPSSSSPIAATASGGVAKPAEGAVPPAPLPGLSAGASASKGGEGAPPREESSPAPSQVADAVSSAPEASGASAKLEKTDADSMVMSSIADSDSRADAPEAGVATLLPRSLLSRGSVEVGKASAAAGAPLSSAAESVAAPVTAPESEAATRSKSATGGSGGSFVSPSSFSAISLPPFSRGPSWEELKRALERGSALSAIRVEELVNAFSYGYPAPARADPVAIIAEIAPCPWNPGNLLLLVGIKARQTADGIAARDATIELEVSRDAIAAWRVLGWDRAAGSAAGDGRGASLKSGAELTILAELVPRSAASGRAGTLRFGWKERPDAAPSLLERAIPLSVAPLESTGDSFRFAAAVAEWAISVAGWEGRGGASEATAIARASKALGADPDGARRSFVDFARSRL